MIRRQQSTLTLYGKNRKKYDEEKILKINIHNIKKNDFFTNEMIYLIEKIHCLSKSKKNKNYIMPLIWKLRRIINFYKGYQVSFETIFDSYSNKEYDEIAYKMSLMSDNHIYLGVYNSIPEMSFYFQDFELANVISIIFNQKSIWDWFNNDEIINQFHEERELF